MSHLSFLILNVLKQNNCVKGDEHHKVKTNPFLVLQWTGLGISVKANSRCIEKFKGKESSSYSFFCFPLAAINREIPIPPMY